MGVLKVKLLKSFCVYWTNGIEMITRQGKRHKSRTCTKCPKLNWGCCSSVSWTFATQMANELLMTINICCGDSTDIFSLNPHCDLDGINAQSNQILDVHSQIWCMFFLYPTNLQDADSNTFGDTKNDYRFCLIQFLCACNNAFMLLSSETTTKKISKILIVLSNMDSNLSMYHALFSTLNTTTFAHLCVCSRPFCVCV